MPDQETKTVPIMEDDDLVRSKCLYRPDRPDLSSTWRCLWPSYDPPSKLCKACESFDAPVWIEIGLGPHSLLHMIPARRVMLFDTRPWVLRLMDQAHDPEVWNYIVKLSANHNPNNMGLLLQMRSLCANLDTPLKQAMALILLASTGGRTLKFPAFDASLVIGGMMGKPATLRRSKHCIISTMILQNAATALRVAARGTRNSAKHVHIHINEILPMEETVNMLLSLRNIGFSWSMAIYDPRVVHDVKHLADIFDWGGVSFAWCKRSE